MNFDTTILNYTRCFAVGKWQIPSICCQQMDGKWQKRSLIIPYQFLIFLKEKILQFSLQLAKILDFWGKEKKMSLIWGIFPDLAKIANLLSGRGRNFVKKAERVR